MFQRLTLSKTAKYVKSFVVFLCFYAAKVGAPQLVELIDNIQAQYVFACSNKTLIRQFVDNNKNS